MDITSAGLLERLRVARPEVADWRHLHDLDRPLIHSWLGQAGLTAEADGLTQEFLVVVRERPAFRRQWDGSSRIQRRRVRSTGCGGSDTPGNVRLAVR